MALGDPAKATQPLCAYVSLPTGSGTSARLNSPKLWDSTACRFALKYHIMSAGGKGGQSGGNESSENTAYDPTLTSVLALTCSGSHPMSRQGL